MPLNNDARELWCLMEISQNIHLEPRKSKEAKGTSHVRISENLRDKTFMTSGEDRNLGKVPQYIA